MIAVFGSSSTTRITARTIAIAACATVLAIVVSTPAKAQTSHTEFVFSSAPTRIGAGARAAGIGSAFTAVADDATAASWNPAGLIQLERPEISVVGRGSYRIDDVGTLDQSTDTRTATTDVGTETLASGRLNFLSVAIPFEVRGRNVVVSANYQEVFAFDSRLGFESHNAVDGPPPLTVDVRQRADQWGHIDAFSPAAAVELAPTLSAGATLNAWFDGLGQSYAWRRRIRQTTTVHSDQGQTEDHSDELQTFEGVQAISGTFGILWHGDGMLSIGLKGETPFTTDLRRTIAERAREPHPRVTTRIRMRLPCSIAAGLALRPTDDLLVAADATWTDWSASRVWDDAGNEFYVTGDLVRPSGSGGGEIPEHGDAVDDTVTMRLGGEWIVTLDDLVTTWRAGAFFEPDPARRHPASLYGVSAGLGLTTTRLSIDMAYNARFGTNISGTGYLVNTLNAPDAEYDSFQQSLFASVVLYL